MEQKNYMFTSESVTEGHPDKVCDQISDGILDELFKEDPYSRVAVETLTTTGSVHVAGEVTTKGFVDVQAVVRKVLKEIGYTNPKFGIDCDDCGVWSAIHGQSPDISQGVNESAAEGKETAEQGAGDQGMMYGYACDETEELMPLPIVLAHKLTKQLATVRKSNTIKDLGPDGKSQVSVEYEGSTPKRVTAIVVAQQHLESVSEELLRKDILEKVIKPVCKDWIDEQTDIHINSTGKFVIGGPEGDTGLTGRKIIVDTYGGVGKHGGGAFSGKDPSKVDRSGAYAARYIAKNIVAAKLAKKCEVQLSYAIGVAKPTSINVECYGTNVIPEEEISKLVYEHFPIKPKDIITELQLKRPIYQKTAAYGHFGRNDYEFTWERTDKVDILSAELSPKKTSTQVEKEVYLPEEKPTENKLDSY